MIYCSNLEIIFFKTKKVGGTSFEIALSKYCNGNDIVTPVSAEDEITRQSLGFQAPVNYQKRKRSCKLVNLGVKGTFRNHMTADEIRNNLGEKIFERSTKIAIQREQLDFLISQYWFRLGGRKQNSLKAGSFRNWLESNYDNFLENYAISPKSGTNAPDIIIDYENLSGDIANIKELPNDFLETFNSLRAKGGYRPADTRRAEEFFEDNNCSDYIPLIRGLLESS